MSKAILSSLMPQLANAHRIVETLVLRNKQGAVFTIDIGQSLMDDSRPAYGAKVTLVANPPVHMGICEGESVEQVRESAQHLVANGIEAGTPTSVVPKPHIKPTARVDA